MACFAVEAFRQCFCWCLVERRALLHCMCRRKHVNNATQERTALLELCVYCRAGCVSVRGETCAAALGSKPMWTARDWAAWDSRWSEEEWEQWLQARRREEESASSPAGVSAAANESQKRPGSDLGQAAPQFKQQKTGTPSPVASPAAPGQTTSAPAVAAKTGALEPTASTPLPSSGATLAGGAAAAGHAQLLPPPPPPAVPPDAGAGDAGRGDIVVRAEEVEQLRHFLHETRAALRAVVRFATAADHALRDMVRGV